MYLTVYGLALIKMGAVSSVLGSAGVGWLAVPVLVGAACSIPVRLFLIFTVGLGHPAAGIKYRRMLPYLMPWDWLWAPSPFLAVHTIGPEWALLMLPIHLCGDRAIFGNFLKPFSVPFEPTPVPAFQEFTRTLSGAAAGDVRHRVRSGAGAP